MTTRALVVMLTLGLSGCRVDPTQDMNTGQALIDLGDALNDLRAENALLQADLDSLRGAVARQDTLLARLAGMAGLPIPPR